MDVAQDLIYTISRYNYSKQLMILFSDYWHLSEGAFFWMLNFTLKYYITITLQQFTKTLNQLFHLSRLNRNLVELNESKQLWGSFVGKYFNKLTLSEKYKVAFSLKTTECKDIIFIRLSPAMKQLLEKNYFEFPQALNFCCTWNKQAVSYR